MAPDEDMRPVLSLLTQAFAHMEGRIDPPSSLSRMGPAELAQEAARAELWVIDGKTEPLACMILTPKAETLYLGKLAVAHTARGQGLARRMIDTALERARALGLPSVSLQTRIELLENHVTFAALGFEMTESSAHPGYDRPTTLGFRRLV
ncbi:GNAT family acetyltransferase [Rhodobacteraceae bacterium EhC02]|jgi:GNAT superfamily N-acetyltransferase|nr:GNAT family acetyltransferase [Rhodobacteraceae bacterium EhC02]